MKIKSMTAQSGYNGADALTQNSTWRDNSIRITRGGRTQSDYIPKRTYRVNFLPPLHVAGPLNQNSTGRDHSVGLSP